MGKDKDIAVVILHGWKVPAKRYNLLKLELEKSNYRVFIPDMPGNGVGPSPKYPYTLTDYALWVKKYLQKREITKCIIIGHSFGGRVAIKLAADYPNLVRKLVLVGVPGFNPVSYRKINICMLIAKFGYKFFSLPILNKLQNFSRKVLYKSIGTWDYYNTKGIIRTTFKNIIREDLEILMRKLKCPTVLVWGENDKIVPLKIAKKMQKTIPNSELKVVKNTGHDLPYSKPKSLIGSII